MNIGFLPPCVIPLIHFEVPVSHLLFPPKFIQVFARSIALSSSSVKINSQEKETLSNSLLLFTSENSDLSPAKLSNVVRIYTHSFHRHASTNASISKPTHSSLSSIRSSIYDHDFIHLEILEIFHLSSFLEFAFIPQQQRALLVVPLIMQFLQRVSTWSFF